MAGGGGIEDGGFFLCSHNVQHRGDQIACIQRDSLTGLKIHFHIVTLTKRLHNSHESLYIVARFGDVVASSHVHPLHLLEKLGKTSLYRFDNSLQHVGVLFTQRVKVEPFETGQISPFQLDVSGPQPTSWRTGS